MRVIDQNGEQMGVMSIGAALSLAEERQLDLVKIAPGARPPVCKLMDGKVFKGNVGHQELAAWVDGLGL